MSNIVREILTSSVRSYLLSWSASKKIVLNGISKSDINNLVDDIMTRLQAVPGVDLINATNPPKPVSPVEALKPAPPPPSLKLDIDSQYSSPSGAVNHNAFVDNFADLCFCSDCRTRKKKPEGSPA